MIASHAVATRRDALLVDDPRGRFGLCATCRHAETITSSRGAEFRLCRLSLSDARFPKYPRIPVVVCDGYSARSAKDDRSSTDGT